MKVQFARFLVMAAAALALVMPATQACDAEKTGIKEYRTMTQSVVVEPVQMMQTETINARMEEREVSAPVTVTTTTVTRPRTVHRVLTKRVVVKHKAHKRHFRRSTRRASVRRIIVDRPVFIEKRIERVVSKPVYVERPVFVETTVEKPVFIERTVEKPVIIERTLERPVTIEKTIEKPVIIDRVIERPIVIKNKKHHHLLHLNIL